MKNYKVHKVDEFIIKSIKWTSLSRKIENYIIHKVDKFITKSIKWMTYFVHKVDELSMNTCEVDDFVKVHKVDDFIPGG